VNPDRIGSEAGGPESVSPVTVVMGVPDPVLVLLRGTAVPSVSSVAVVAAIAALEGLDAVASALVGGGMALLAMAIGPALHRLCRQVDPAMVVGIALTAYCTVVILLGLGFSLLNDTSWLSGPFAGAGVFVVALQWTVGLIRTSLKLRQPLYVEDQATAER
jgi:hypothetical protein